MRLHRARSSFIIFWQEQGRALRPHTAINSAESFKVTHKAVFRFTSLGSETPRLRWYLKTSAIHPGIIRKQSLLFALPLMKWRRRVRAKFSFFRPSVNQNGPDGGIALITQGKQSCAIEDTGHYAPRVDLWLFDIRSRSFGMEIESSVIIRQGWGFCFYT
jgi:hypothetical protein